MLVFCGSCGKRISNRVTVCPFCHSYRKEPSQTQVAPPTDERVPEENAGGFYVRSKVWDKPCPRCKHPSSVDLYLLSPVWRLLAINTMLALSVLILLDHPYHGVVTTLYPLFTLGMLKIGSKAKCRRCGARLHIGLRGWA